MSLEESPSGLEEQAIEAQNKAAFLMDLRARGIQDVNLLRALEIGVLTCIFASTGILSVVQDVVR